MSLRQVGGECVLRGVCGVRTKGAGEGMAESLQQQLHATYTLGLQNLG